MTCDQGSVVTAASVQPRERQADHDAPRLDWAVRRPALLWLGYALWADRETAARAV
jgi:hypothetical protein